jgi:AcrR family transcriptional regulator
MKSRGRRGPRTAHPAPDAPPPRPDAQPLREACIDQALAIIESEGLEHLSLREVARRLNVSHQAPYKHFENREHILAETVGKAFAAFTTHLQARPRHDEPLADLASLGTAYLAYALKHPAQYRLMFGAPLPDPVHNPQLLELAEAPFAILRDVIARLTRDPDPEETRRDALFAWSAVHGLASILETRVAERLGLQAADLADVVSHELRRIAAGVMKRPVEEGGAPAARDQIGE